MNTLYIIYKYTALFLLPRGTNISHTHERGGTNILHTHGVGGINIVISRGGQRSLHQGGTNMLEAVDDADEETDVSEANLLVSKASKLSAGGTIFWSL